MLEALDNALGRRVEVTGANAGLHMVVWLRDVSPAQLEAVMAHAADRGVGVYSVAPYYATPPRAGGLLLGYAGLTEREIGEGIRLLAKTIGPRRRR